MGFFDRLRSRKKEPPQPVRAFKNDATGGDPLLMGPPDSISDLGPALHSPDAEQAQQDLQAQVDMDETHTNIQ